MDSFSTKTLRYLSKTDNKYYVYRLIDPRTLHTFYIGKGVRQQSVFSCKESSVRRNKSLTI